MALLDSPRLRQRRFDSIPLRGLGSAATEVQGRRPGDSTTPAELSELISSISTVGVLQPVLAEEVQQDDGPPRLLLVAGERRLLACRWGASHMPDNPHFEALPAIICPGPLSAEERRVWQIVENLAREPLRPGEQAAALLLHRCAVLTGKLLRAGLPIPAEVYGIEDPVERWEALERIRGQDPRCAASWPEVLRRIGLQLSPRKARQLVAAFKALPRHISEEMDEERVRLHTRIRFGQLMAGRREAAEGIWAAVNARKQTTLLPSAVQAAIDDPTASAQEALDRAEQRHQRANDARSHALSRTATAGLPAELARASQEDQQTYRSSEELSALEDDGAEERQATLEPAHVDEGTRAAAEQCLIALRALCAHLREDARLDRYTSGSLRLLLDEVRPLLNTAEDDS
ncbi:ParB/RepB/Spo0J family partition protein [Allosalinactinospora lopnorensis]|uniref:ParB/RepB/Spo0J family partition protein n=1 Tax=Allosalinactinospora lopnorensis TaxID=1352348 RepID=UPI0006240012|nr:ParB N-terminal domain-containing protein [Allosalinactinospora lopnorensis]